MASADYRRSRNKQSDGFTLLKFAQQETIKCSECGSEESSMWKRLPNGDEESFELDSSTDEGDESRRDRIICQRCHGRIAALSRKVAGGDCEPSMFMRSVSAIDLTARSRSNTPDSTSGSISMRRASARAIRQITSASHSTRTQSPVPVTQVKPIKIITGNRRSAVFKSRASKIEKGPTNKACVRTCTQLWQQDRLYRVGDVVSMQDIDDLCLYYAQLRGLIIDEYCNKFAVLTWLLPLKTAPREAIFDEETYVQGFIDEKFYSLDCLEFVATPTANHLVPNWTMHRVASQKIKQNDFKILDGTVEEVYTRSLWRMGRTSELFELRPDPFDQTAPPTTIRVCLFREVKNIEELKELLHTGAIDAALIRPELVMEPFQLLAASNRAIACNARNKLSTKGVHTEIVYSLSPTKNISESLTTFGINEESTNILAVIVGDDKGTLMKKLAAKIKGRAVALQQLKNIADIDLVKKAYHVRMPELNKADIVDAVVSRIVSKDYVA